MDLGLVPVDQLLKEVDNRCEIFVAAYQLTEDKERKDIFNVWKGKGSWLGSVALADVLHNECLNNWDGELETLQEINEEE